MASFAHKHTNKNTIDYYYLSSEQYTIHENKENEGDYENILNKKGLDLLDEIKSRCRANDYTDTFIKYTLSRRHSGIWIADTKSSHYNSEDTPIMNNYNNLVIYGFTQEAISKLGRDPIYNDKKKMTSPIILYTDKWCYTKNGNLYKLIEQM